MISNYVFLTNEGYTIPPDVNQEVENAQVLGVFSGQNEKEAFENFKRENKYLKEAGFKEIYCYKLSNDLNKNAMYFYL